MIGRTRLGFVIGVIGLLVVAGAHSVATADTPEPVTCESLQTTLSDNKNYYIFDAKAAGNAASILGYTFDFGDHQSYTFTFKPGSTDDHHAATVTHTYRNTGTYKATVQVVLKNAQKTTKVTSEACKASITIEPAADTLPDTGNNVPMLALFTGSTVVGSTMYHLFRKYRRSYNARS